MKICLLGILRFIAKVSGENKEPAVTVFSGLLQKVNIVQGCQSIAKLRPLQVFEFEVAQALNCHLHNVE